MTTNKIIVLITGANTGLGFEIVKALCRSEQQYEILLGGRSMDKAEAAVGVAHAQYPESQSSVTAIQVDIENDESIARAFDTVATRYGRLDVLVNNAGAQYDQQLATGTLTMRQVWDKSWSTNTTSTQVLTHTFVPLLLHSSSPRLLFITSGTSTLTDHTLPHLPINRTPTDPPGTYPKTTFLGLPAYRASKTGLNMLMREWHRLLRGDGVKVWAVSPGMLATGLGSDREANLKAGAISPEVGAEVVRGAIEGKRDEEVGMVVRRDGVQDW